VKELLTLRTGVEESETPGNSLAEAAESAHSAACAGQNGAGMKVIDEETWSWMLLADGESLYLSVVCGSVGIYELVVALDAAEAADYGREGRNAADRLARAIAYGPRKFTARNLRDFHERPAVAEAVATWRANKG